MKGTSLILVTLLALSAIAPSIALADAVPDIVFSNAWFGDYNARIEVAPGDRNVQLVIELVNSMEEPIRYVEGNLYLPEGFKDARSGGSIAGPSVSERVPAGGRFYLTFLLDVGDDVELGMHVASLALRYVEWDEDAISLTNLKVSFRITGRSIVKPVLSGDVLEPGEPETLALTVKNLGSAPASSTEIWIESRSPGLAVLEGGGRHFLGNIAPGSSIMIPLKVLASRSLADSIASISIIVAYVNSHGLGIQENHQLSLAVAPLGGVGVILDAIIENPILEPSESSDLTIIVTNRGSETARDVNLEVALSQIANPPITIQEGSLAAKLGDLAPGDERKLTLKVFVNELASGKSFTIPISITYFDDEGRHMAQRGLTITVLEESVRNRLRIYSSEYVRGGMIESANITIENISGGELEDVTITISPTVGWVTLLGPTTWNLPSLKNGERKVMELKVYIPSETSVGSTVGEPFTLRVLASFREPGGRVRNEEHLLGMYVRGIIDIKLQEISIEKLGGELLLIGRILNEGTEKASYTRVEVVGGDIAAAKISYLGDVEPNAPILFNIPIEGIAKNEGSARVALKISYLDSLRNLGEEVIEASVEVPVQSVEPTKEAKPNIIQEYLPAISAIAIIIAVAIAVYAVRRSRRVEAP
ncbi:MAG: hypothetical protein NZ918_02190 [Aigarchaeota archaeon]|nr:hypothetical protein [Aigarchaeota archaeon]MDW8021416.1 hypothetical protein [Nitrososphaerota archaeon]